MWIVRIALDRPYTFVVLALLILILSPLVILRTPTDIFPNINIPVIAVVWTYTGLNAEEMEGRLTTSYERSLTTLVDNIQHIELTSYNGLALVKIFLQPGASLDTANAQVTAASQLLLRQMPPGTEPPEILNYSASSVPILQLGLSGDNLSEQQLNDLGLNFLRTQLVTVPGADDSVSIRRQAASGHHRLQSVAVAGKGIVADRRAERGGRSRPGGAVRHGQDLAVRIRRADQLGATHAGAAQ